MKIRLLFFSLVLFLQLLSSQENVTVLPFDDEALKEFPSIRDFTITQDETEAYFTAQSLDRALSIIIVIKKDEKGKWSNKKIASFSGSYSDLEPFLSQDGLRLYFVSNRPVSKEDETKDFDIWYVERESLNHSWSEPINPGSPVNSQLNEFYPAITNSKNLYFTLLDPDKKRQDDIYVCIWNGEKYESPKPLSDAINSDGAEYNAYVAPDESYIIFSGWKRDGSVGGGDLHISRKDSNGAWLQAENLGKEINSKQIDYCPYVNTKTNTLYFTSRRSNIVKTKFNDFNAFMEQLNKYEDGSSRIYKSKFKS